MSDLLFLGALSCLHKIFKCPVGLREALLVATLEALLAAEPERGPCPHGTVPGPSLLAAGYACVSCRSERPCLHSEITSVYFMGLLRIK